MQWPAWDSRTKDGSCGTTELNSLSTPQVRNQTSVAAWRRDWEIGTRDSYCNASHGAQGGRQMTGGGGNRGQDTRAMQRVSADHCHFTDSPIAAQLHQELPCGFWPCLPCTFLHPHSPHAWAALKQLAASTGESLCGLPARSAIAHAPSTKYHYLEEPRSSPPLSSPAPTVPSGCLPCVRERGAEQGRKDEDFSWKAGLLRQAALRLLAHQRGFDRL